MQSSLPCTGQSRGIAANGDRLITLSVWSATRQMVGASLQVPARHLFAPAKGSRQPPLQREAAERIGRLQQRPAPTPHCRPGGRSRRQLHLALADRTGDHIHPAGRPPAVRLDEPEEGARSVRALQAIPGSGRGSHLDRSTAVRARDRRHRPPSLVRPGRASGTAARDRTRGSPRYPPRSPAFPERPPSAAAVLPWRLDRRPRPAPATRRPWHAGTP